MGYLVWNVDPEIFRLGPLALRWYGLLFACGFILGYFILRQIYRNEERPEENLSSLFVYILLGTVIGARLGHILFYQPDYYLARPWEILMIWQGGLASHGGYTGVLIALYLYLKKYREMNFLELSDRLVIASLPAASFIRIGNLFNSEILGVPSDLPWAIIFLRVDNIPRHPATLYESLSYLVVFSILYIAYWKTAIVKIPGRILGAAFVACFTARFLIEFVKQEQVSFEQGMFFNLGQLLSIPFILLGLILLYRRQKLDRAWRVVFLAALILALSICPLPFLQSERPAPVYSADRPFLKPVQSISDQFQNHIHGLGYDSQSQRLFIATHYGLFLWKDRKLFQLGEVRDDFMGFSLHPSNPDIIYTSGHPKKGGNIGVMISEDGGVTFKRILQESVDFHSMTVSPANRKILYGWFKGKLYRTKDGGKTWDFASGRGMPQQGFCFGAPCLTADTKDERSVYAGTPNGLLVSHDFGENWTTVNATLGGVAGVGVDPSHSHRLFAFTKNLALAHSLDRGKSWQARNKGLKLSRDEFIFAFAFDQKNSTHLFAATPEQIFWSRDGGRNWEKIL